MKVKRRRKYNKRKEKVAKQFYEWMCRESSRGIVGLSRLPLVCVIAIVAIAA
jgi:hypothetical protein